MWPFRRRGKKRGSMEEDGLAEARQARAAAEQRLAVTERELTVPLREMHRENHIQPAINALIQGHVRRGPRNGPAAH